MLNSFLSIKSDFKILQLIISYLVKKYNPEAKLQGYMKKLVS